jgi:hypothetical protein
MINLLYFGDGSKYSTQRAVKGVSKWWIGVHSVHGGLFFEMYKRGFKRIGSMTTMLHTMVLSCFPYNSLTSPMD